MVAQDALVGAFSTGDVAGVAAFFASDAGRKRMVETERYLATVPIPLTVGTLPELQAGFNPWYLSTQGPFGQRVSLLDKAIEHGHGEVLDWLYDWPNAAPMCETLAFVFTDACATAVRVNDLPTVDMLLSSRIFLDVVPDNNKQAILNRLLESHHAFTSSAMLELLIAHGANISSPATLATCASVAELEQVELLLRNGTSVVGYEVLSEPAFRCKTDTVRRLIECGADVNSGNGITLYRACVRVHFRTVKVLLEEGFADVGAETIYGQTALMAATSSGRSMVSVARRPSSAKDPDQLKTGSSAQVRNILLQHGANPRHDRSNIRW